MTIPPFPSQDLAKLVLGYLAEEQLMTAYDEFLQASPYLDAYRNEYDRIFMTSLKNILAEYRAVKIYVETCKPFLLRKKLVQCTNLLEVVKLLVSYADVNKLQVQDVTSDKVSLPKNNSSLLVKHNACEVCASLNLPSCTCKSRQSKQSLHSVSHLETSSLENSVETTALEDLPGHHTVRKKHVRLDKDSISEPNLNISENTRQTNTSNGFTNTSNSVHAKSNESSSLNLISSIVKGTDTSECRDKIEEFNNILNKVCNKSNSDTQTFRVSESEVLGSRQNAGFQNFASGVTGHENKNVPVPDSSTSENLTAQVVVKDNPEISKNINEAPKDENEHMEKQPNSTYPFPRIKPNDQKIKIISDIKVDSPYVNMNNATSTPLMQTIVINGTPAYKQKLPMPNNNYTTDEIMAMPTIIVVPTSGPPQKLTQTQPELAQKIKKVKTRTVTSTSTRVLGPLVIDVSSSPAAIDDKDTANMAANFKNAGLETGLVKTVDLTKNASVPKDNTISDSTQSNTPQVLPPLRKSSSTPRRNSHIRVLDFTTPRRILHETISEKVPEESNNKTVEIVVTRSPNVVFTEATSGASNIVDMSNVKVHKIDTTQINKLNEQKEIRMAPKKISNWDADLRALIANDSAAQATVKKPRIKKKKTSKLEKPPEEIKETDDVTQTKKPTVKRKGSPKGKKSKRKKLEEEEEQYKDAVNEAKVSVKPTFNIVAADVQNTQQENSKSTDCQNKYNNDDANETPETERLSLQNEIGAKLNISDLLETPYKQALYDIQMETPKFIGSVLPDEPISDIKIMNIPTPRFFDTPKPAQATPYASRATDYSSGGSYYKPDEQDYLRIPDLECPVTSSKEESHVDKPKQKDADTKKSSRPVRKCTKNVSYKSSVTKGKVEEDKVEVDSICSDSTSINSSFEHSKENRQTPKTPKDVKSKLPPKSETKKKIYPCKTRKSPVKKDKSNTFMKIKPRRPTPIKDSNKRARRKPVVFQNSPQKTLVKKRASGKDKFAAIAPVISSAAPTKSRRKSSTPRKLHCSKQFNSESSADSPEINSTNVKNNLPKDQNLPNPQDSDTEQLALRWSDDGSQDAKVRVSECEDISKIKEYIEKSALVKTDYNNAKGTLQVDLIKRGFDAETAKIIERDLLDTPTDMETTQSYVTISVTQKDVPTVEKSNESNRSFTNELQIVQDVEEDDEIELSVHECNEESDNYIMCKNEATEMPHGELTTLKDSWSMEVCIDDGLPIRLRATNCTSLFENEPYYDTSGYSIKETEMAISSISNIDTLYTPLKDRRAQCYEIFDSTLTSLDTPLKLSSPKEKILKTTEIEIVVEEEKVEVKEKTEIKKRKRLQNSNSSDDCINDNKKTKPEAQYLFNSTNIQNIDIESVLKKLHGP